MIIFPLLLLAASGLYAPDTACDQQISDARAHLSRYIHSGKGSEQLLASLHAVRECLDPENSSWHWATVTEADVLMREGLLEASREKLETYLSRHSGMPISWYVRALLLRGRLYSREGQSFEYLRSLLEAVQWVDELDAEWRFRLYVDLAYAYSSVGALEQADRVYAEALSTDYDSVTRLTYLDLVLRRAVDRGELLSLNREPDSLTVHANIQEAVGVVEEMEEIIEALGNRATRYNLQILATAYNSLYELYQQASDPARALESTRRALDILPESFTWQRAQIYRRLGWALLAVEEMDDALYYFQRALPLFAEHLSGKSDAYLGIATVYVKQGRLNQAEVVLHEAILMQEEPVNLSSWGILVADRGMVLRRALVGVLLEQGCYEEAYVVLEETFGRRVRDAQQVVYYQRESEEFRRTYSQMQEELREARHQVFLEPEDSSALARLRRIEAEAADLIPGPGGQISVSLPDIQARLQHDDRVLLTYFLDDPAYVFVVRSDTFAAIPLSADHDALWEEVRRIGFAGRYGATPAYIEAEPLQKLYEYVFAPVEHLVPEGAPVTVIADGALAEVPFSMLVAGDAPRFQYHTWPFLVHRNPFSLEVAGSMIGERFAERANSRVVVMGRSAFGSNDVSLLGGNTPPPLPYVRRELGSVYRHVGADVLLFDEQATRRELLRNIQSAGILHVASHVQVAPDPSFTSILMASDSPETSGAVYLQDLLGLEIPAQLVVLSACESMQGAYRRGEGLMGLHYAFRSAGTDATLATLWPVDDEVMADLMDVFYAELAAGAPKDVALQRAQQSLLSSRERLEASPFLWAGLVLSGDASPVVIEYNRRNYTWVWTFLAGLLVGAAIWYYRKRHTSS